MEPFFLDDLFPPTEPITLPVTQTVISGTTTILPEDSITPPLSTLSTPESKQQWIQSFFEPTDEHGNIQPTNNNTHWKCTRRNCRHLSLVDKKQRSSMNGRLRHLKTHSITYIQDPNQPTLFGGRFSGFQMSIFNEKLAKFIACCAQPFSLVEEPDFRDLIAYTRQGGNS